MRAHCALHPRNLDRHRYPFGQAVESSDRRVKSDCAAAPFAATAVVDCLRPCGPSRLGRTLTADVTVPSDHGIVRPTASTLPQTATGQRPLRRRAPCSEGRSRIHRSEPNRNPAPRLALISPADIARPHSPGPRSCRGRSRSFALRNDTCRQPGPTPMTSTSSP